MNNRNSIHPISIALDDKDSSKGDVTVPLSKNMCDQFYRYIADLEANRQEMGAPPTEDAWWLPVYRKPIKENGLPRSVNVFSSEAMNRFFHQAYGSLN